MQLDAASQQPGSRPVRIVIAAVEPSFRTLLRRQLESDPWIQVVGDGSDTRSACALTRQLKPDILLIECGLNRHLSTRCPPGPVDGGVIPETVVIVEAERIQDIVEAFDLGAKGIVLRTSLPLLWRVGIQSILAGHYWVENKSVAVLLEAVRGLAVQPAIMSLPKFGLTIREMEIAAKIAAGRSNKDVSREFAICERTVKHHLTNIFRKTGVSSRLELAVLMRDGIVLAQQHRSSEKPQLYQVTEP